MENRKDYHRAAIRQMGCPFYLYDERILFERIALVRRALPRIGVCFAMKAAPALAGVLKDRVDRLEVCSTGEYAICFGKEVTPEKILVSGVNKTEESLRWILDRLGERGCYTIESEQHFRLLDSLAAALGKKLSCYIRLSSGNQFGVDREELEHLCEKVIASPQLELVGIHYFSGTQKTIKRIEKELTELAEYGKKLQQQLGRKLSLEYGPGLSVNCFCKEQAGMDAEGISAAADAAILQEQADATAQLQELGRILEETRIREVFEEVTFEYGRFLAACCGFYFTKVADLKTTEGVNYAILDGGLHQITYFGSMAGMKLPFIDVMKEDAGDLETDPGRQDYLLAGSLCSANDVLVRKAALPELSIGDILRFSLAGAYCSTEGISLLLTRDLPALAVLLEDGSIKPLRGHMGTSMLNAPDLQDPLSVPYRY